MFASRCSKLLEGLAPTCPLLLVVAGLRSVERRGENPPWLLSRTTEGLLPLLDLTVLRPEGLVLSNLLTGADLTSLVYETVLLTSRVTTSCLLL